MSNAARRDGRPVRSSSASAPVMTFSQALTPSQRSGSGSHRGDRWPTHGRRDQVGVPLEHQVGEGPAGEVGRADTPSPT